MTDRQYRRIQSTFDRQARANVPYSPTRAGLVPLIASAWREYWRPDPALGVSADVQAMVTLCGFCFVVCAVAGFVAQCCGF